MTQQHGTATQPGGKTDRLLFGGFLLSLAGIAFLAGMIVSISQMPPYRTVRDAWIGLSAVIAQHELLAAPWPAYMWTPTKRAEQGLVTRETSRSTAGFTVYTTSHDGSTLLVDADGRQVHRWETSFRKVWPQARHVPNWIPDHFIHVRKAHVFSNGDLLVVYCTTANTPSGCGLAKLDRDGNRLWTFDGNAHHDFDLAPDGTIYALTHRIRHLGADDELSALSTVPLVEDEVTILSPEGKRLKTISILDALIESPYFRPILSHVDRYGDILHVNTVDVIDESFARHYDEISPGDVMVCLRNLQLVAVLHPESGQIVWATTGPWNHPHDPDPLASGNVLIFDNYCVQGAEHGSAVVEFDPRTRQIVWQYHGSSDAPLRSDIRSRQQLLPGGNVLVTDSDNGRLLEVTRDGTLVWEFLNPVRGGENDELIPVVCGGHRYTAAELPFLSHETVQNNKSTLARAEP
jgi:hypothetical protein